jgi:hypothetical protein
MLDMLTMMIAGMTNYEIRSGWVIDEDECKSWMKEIMDETKRYSVDGTHSQGGWGDIGNLRSVSVDPNAA